MVEITSHISHGTYCVRDGTWYEIQNTLYMISSNNTVCDIHVTIQNIMYFHVYNNIKNFFYYYRSAIGNTSYIFWIEIYLNLRLNWRAFPLVHHILPIHISKPWMILDIGHTAFQAPKPVDIECGWAWSVISTCLYVIQSIYSSSLHREVDISFYLSKLSSYIHIHITCKNSFTS